MKTSTTPLLAAGAALLLALAGCKQHGDSAMQKTRFPGMVTADGGTSGQVMAASPAPKTDATYAGGTPGIAGGAGGTTSGAATGGTVTETGKGPSQGVTPPGDGKGTASMPGAIQQPSGDNKPPPAPSAAEQAPQPGAAHRDPGASTAAPGR